MAGRTQRPSQSRQEHRTTERPQDIAVRGQDPAGAGAPRGPWEPVRSKSKSKCGVGVYLKHAEMREAQQKRGRAAGAMAVDDEDETIQAVLWRDAARCDTK